MNPAVLQVHGAACNRMFGRNQLFDSKHNAKQLAPVKQASQCRLSSLGACPWDDGGMRAYQHHSSRTDTSWTRNACHSFMCRLLLAVRAGANSKTCLRQLLL